MAVHNDILFFVLAKLFELDSDAFHNRLMLFAKLRGFLNGKLKLGHVSFADVGALKVCLVEKYLRCGGLLA